MADKTYRHDVTVLGVGWSGLLACKYMLEEGLTVVALEKREDIGGVWLYSDDPGISTVMQSTRTTSSSTMTEFSDFPMSEEMGQFPHHADVKKYLNAYADKFNLRPHIKLRVQVRNVEKDSDQWCVYCANGELYTSSYLVVATGLHQSPNMDLVDAVLEGYSGKIYHAQEIKNFLPQHEGQRLLVMGGGETGSDLCLEWFKHMQFIYWSIPRGQHFFRKYGKVVPWASPQALDKASSRIMKLVAPYHKGKPGLSWVCKWSTSGSLLAYQGHGIPEWKNNSEFFHFFLNKHGHVLDLVDYKRLVPKAAVTGCNLKEVTFVDGSKQEFDLIILSTGYKVDHPFLPQRYRVGIQQRYKYIFDVEDPTITFIGLARPVIGSIPALAELQARWAARVFSHRLQLPPLEERSQETGDDAEFWNNYFKDSSRRLQGLVEAYTYVDDIGKKSGVYPDYWFLFRTNLYHWFVAMFSPLTPATALLNDPRQREQAIATMNRHRAGTLNPTHLLLIFFLRIIMFDWWLNKIGNVKYHIQRSRWWPYVRDLHVVRAANFVWCLPKRAFFDNKSIAPIK